jgi:hypothetical protein
MVADESDLVAILRTRLDELNVSYAELDAECDLPGGYTSKRLAQPQIKYFGKEAFWNICERAGIAVLLVVDPNATKRYATRMNQRAKQYARGDNHFRNAKVVAAIRELVRKNAALGGHARAAALSEDRATYLARRAVNARWRKYRKALREKSKADRVGAGA